MSDRFELFLTCPKGLEGLLIEEAVGLGLEEAREHTSAVRGMADMETAYRLCLWSRLANRVLLVLKRFPMKDAEDLYHGVLDIEWQTTCSPTAPWRWSSAATARASTTPTSAR
jgi:23S rRNA (guanine2445-N2)-methyltransferase / 23S rRNA (guanine2069-N7)-methyltransferase